MQVSIIIVNYNTKDLTLACLKSIYEQTKDIDFEVIVSDNGSVDESIEAIKSQFPQVILLENNANLGFGKANNEGLKAAKGKYIFYLNSDTILLNNAVKIFYDWFESDDAAANTGAIGANLLNSQKKFMHSFGRFPDFSSMFSGIVHQLYGITKETFKHFILRKPFPLRDSFVPACDFYTGDVDYITGADLFLKNDENAYFDPWYFMYYEENDLQFKMDQLGLKRTIIDGPQIIHLEGASAKKETNIMSYLASFSYINSTISSIYYFKKNYKTGFKLKIMKLLVLLLWLNPYLFSSNKKHIKKLWKADKV